MATVDRVLKPSQRSDPQNVEANNETCVESSYTKSVLYRVGDKRESAELTPPHGFTHLLTRENAMSLDVYLTENVTISHSCEHCGKTCSISTGGSEVYSANITHNLGRMASEAGIYEACWRPEEIGISKAGQLIPLLKDGLQKLKDDPAHFEKFNAENGWGMYHHFVPWVEKYLAACEEHPDASVRVWR